MKLGMYDYPLIYKYFWIINNFCSDFYHVVLELI